MFAVFCYGTLEFPQVMEAVTGRRFPSISATLEGYARFLIKNAVYPGIIPATGERIDGTLYRNVDPRSMRRLDRYEDSLYVRRAVTVYTCDGQVTEAQTYVIPRQQRRALSSKLWDRNQFSRHHLKSYLARLRT